MLNEDDVKQMWEEVQRAREKQAMFELHTEAFETLGRALDSELREVLSEAASLARSAMVTAKALREAVDEKNLPMIAWHARSLGRSDLGGTVELLQRVRDLNESLQKRKGG